MAGKSIQLEEDQVTQIIDALLIGLACYGEVEKNQNAVEILKSRGVVVDRSLCTLHPTGSVDVPSDFAAALQFLHAIHLKSA